MVRLIRFDYSNLNAFIPGSEQRVFVRLGHIWYYTIDRYSTADETALKELVRLCAKFSAYCYARHLVPEELDELRDLVAEFMTLIHKHDSLESLRSMHKVHQLSHLDEVFSLWTGHLANVEAHESLNKVRSSMEISFLLWLLL